jgi:MFS family permease
VFLARRFPVFAIRDFRLLFADRLLAPSAFAFSLVGVSFAVLDATGSTSDLSYVLAAQIVPSVLFVLFGGVIADRIRPQVVIAAGNLLMSVGEGGFGLLVLTHQARLWEMIVCEVVTGTGIAPFWPASTALLPKIVPAELIQQANAVGRLAQNGAQMGGAAVAGLAVAGIGPGWALLIDGIAMLGTIPMNLAIRAPATERGGDAGMLHELREGWVEFRSRTWLWAIVLEYTAVMAGSYGGFDVLGPVVAKADLGGPAAWGAISAALSVGLLLGGVASLRYEPRRPMVVVAGLAPLLVGPCFALGAGWPLAAVMAVALLAGVSLEVLMVQWNVALARFIPADRLARVSSYDALGSIMAMPLGALAAGPLAVSFGVTPVEYGVFALAALAAVLSLLSRDVRVMRMSDAEPTEGVTPVPSLSSSL